ncbi:MAG: permease [Candidatus Izemoplasmatales bacterium]|nr:permease [Candidatus Izemoplasmatales bacterium]
MLKFIKKNKFLLLSVLMLIIISIIDITLTYKAFTNTWDQVLSMLMIVPPIFALIGLFDVWVDRETVIKLMGSNSGIKGMALAFFLGAFSAGPTLAAFPLALIMLKKGAKYSNVLFFLMVWSSLKLPIVFYQITTIGFKFSMIINLTMLIIFVLGALLSEKLFKKEELETLQKKAINYSK